MEPEEPLLQGILLFPPQGMLGQLKKTWHKRFCQLFKASKSGIERLEIYDSHEEALSQQHSPRIVILEACVKIAPSNQPHVFTVVTKTGVHHFGCFSETDMTNWICAFQSVAFKDNISSQTIEEDNDLYCTSGEGVFSVKVVETDASKRCGLEAKSYTLIVASVDIKLMDGDVVLYTWPYKYIRRYGYRDGKFNFEAGRKCESGEGSFRLEHSNQQEIFRCISSKMKSMKKLLSGKSSPSIECNDAQYHAALTMEAGSRSPLPPSPNSSTSVADLDFSTISQISQKHLNSSSSSLDSITFIKPPPPIMKPKPAKPPRKHMFTALLERKSFEPEFSDVSTCGKYRKLKQAVSPELPPKDSGNLLSEDEEKHPYDSVEVRSDAWKTHGLNNVPHTERPKPCTSGSNRDNDDDDNDDESQYETVDPFTLISQSSAKTKSTASEIMTPTSPIIHNVSSKTDAPNYDKLQYFGSTHKLNSNPGYKTPNLQSTSHSTPVGSTSNPLPSVSTLDSQASWNNYDVVEDMCAVRLADDSHLGYGVIRKKTQPSPPSTSTVGPQHKVYNETEYAIVSKPKRV